jgi:hypothetical protein
MFLNANLALYQFYVLLMVPSFAILFYGCRCWYKGYYTNNENLRRRGKLLTLFGVIALLSITAVSFIVTGKMPY